MVECERFRQLIRTEQTRFRGIVARLGGACARGGEYHRDGMDTGGGLVDGINAARSLTISPDGKNVYVVGQQDHAVAVFKRDLTTGSLTFLEFITDTDIGGTGLTMAWDVKVSPDGAYVYVGSRDDNAVSTFSRDPVDGTLTFVEAVVNGGGICVEGRSRPDVGGRRSNDLGNIIINNVAGEAGGGLIFMNDTDDSDVEGNDISNNTAQIGS